MGLKLTTRDKKMRAMEKFKIDPTIVNSIDIVQGRRISNHGIMFQNASKVTHFRS